MKVVALALLLCAAAHVMAQEVESTLTPAMFRNPKRALKLTTAYRVRACRKAPAPGRSASISSWTRTT